MSNPRPARLRELKQGDDFIFRATKRRATVVDTEARDKGRCESVTVLFLDTEEEKNVHVGCEVDTSGDFEKRFEALCHEKPSPKPRKRSRAPTARPTTATT